MTIADLTVLFEDNHLIAVNKPNGVLVQADETGDRTLADVVKIYIKDRYNKPGDVFLGTIHRIDRPVSGVVIYARTSKGLTRMNDLFRERKVKKTYWAIVEERPEPLEGQLVHYLTKDRQKNVAHAHQKGSRRGKNAKKAVLNYRLMGEIGTHHLLEIDLETGRPHQIRVQLSKAGMPIRGDLKYQSKHKTFDGSIHLHCHNISFIHPVKKEPVTITAPPPNTQFWNLFK